MNYQNSPAGSGYSGNNNQLEKSAPDYAAHLAPSQTSTHGAEIDRVMTLFINNKATRKLAKAVVRYNSAAVLGALAYRANENWRSHTSLHDVEPITGHDITQSSPLPQFIDYREDYGEGFLAPILMKAMIAAAKADGLVNADEQHQLLKAAWHLGFNPDEIDFISALMKRDISLEEMAQSVARNKHKSEVYLAAYFAISGENDAGRDFLTALANAMGLDDGLWNYLERQAELGIAQ